jgi:hypothetical protein
MMGSPLERGYGRQPKGAVQEAGGISGTSSLRKLGSSFTSTLSGQAWWGTVGFEALFATTAAAGSVTFSFALLKGSKPIPFSLRWLDNEWIVGRDASTKIGGESGDETKKLNEIN